MSIFKYLLVACALLVTYLVFKNPSVDTIVADLSIASEQGRIELNGVTYEAQWGNEITLSGDLRYFGRAYSEYAAYITHDAVLTTGEFSNPEIVTIKPMRKGNTSWRAPRQPSGTFLALHFIPLNATVLDKLKQLKEGDRVEFVGREETDSSVTGSDGSIFKLLHTNHKLLLVSDIKRR